MPSDKYYKKFEEEVISKDTDYNWTDVRLRNPKPSWKDLAEKRIAISFFHLNRLKDNLEAKHFCILVGDKDRGKTWLSYALGCDLVEQKKRVKYASVDENFNAEAAWMEIESQELRGRDKPETYLIIEDCHLNHEECQELFQKILDEGEVNLRFLFTMRRTGKILLEDIESEDIFYNEGKKLNCIVHLASNNIMKAHVKNIIEEFILSKNIYTDSSKEDIDNVAVKWGDDLYWVWLRLRSWNYLEGQRLSEVSDDQVYESIWSDRGEIKLSLPGRRKLLFSLAVFCQFEGLSVFELVDFIEDNREILNDLREGGIVAAHAKEGCDFISIPDDFAGLILNTLSWKDPTFKRCGTDSQIELIRNYMKFNPPNWLRVYQTLYRARESEKSAFVKDIITSLWADNEIYTMVSENVKALSLNVMIELNDSLIWSEGRTSWKESEKASNIRSLYIRHCYPTIRNRIKNSSARSLMKLIRSLHRVFNTEALFDRLEVSDYVHIANNSALNSLYNLIKDTIERKGVGASLAKKMARALPDADLVGLLSREGASLYRLNGIIRDLLSIDPSSADKFVNKLSALDLDDLLYQEDPIAMRKGISKVQTINYFLSRSLSLFPVYRKQIVDKVNDIKWGRLFRSANFEQGFWLLWNIFINNSETAKRRVQNGTTEILQDKWLEEQDEKYILPLVSILHLCNYEINKLRQKIPINRIEEIIESLKREKKPTLLILSLLACKIILSQEEFNKIKEILDQQSIDFIQATSDLKVKKVLNNLIEVICEN